MSATPIDRPLIVGGDNGPSPPFPLRMEGPVIKGFGRGSKKLGIPTANLPVDGAQMAWMTTVASGVYFGWATVSLPATHPDAAPLQPLPMVMSIGYNPFFGNTTRSAEVHVLASFAADFYSCPLRLLVLAFVRPERDYPDLPALVADIRLDCDVARQSLARPAWRPGPDDDQWLRECPAAPPHAGPPAAEA